MHNENVNPELASFLNGILCREGPSGWAKSVYKGTDCGAWIRVEHDTVELGSIVEGSDVEAGPTSLEWPFTADQFWGALQEVESEAAFYWDRDNSRDYKIIFTPQNKPASVHFLHETWGEYEWSDDTPQYVKSKVQHWLKSNGECREIGRPVGIALGVSVTKFDNEIEY